MEKRMKLGIGLGLAFVTATGALARGQEGVGSVIGHMKDVAYGSNANMRQPLLMTGTAVYEGVNDQYSLVEDPSGRFRETLKGDFGQEGGFDGKSSWAADYSGMPGPTVLEDRDMYLGPMFVTTGAWMTNPSLMEVALSAAGSNERDVALTLKLHGGFFSGTLVVDRQTWLPRTFTYMTSEGPHVVTYSNYKTFLGRQIATHWVDAHDGQQHVFDVAAVTEAPHARDQFKMPTALPADFHFDPSVAPRVEIRKAVSGHLLVKPLINGKDVGWFILDTGAGNQCIDPKAADALGLKEFGKGSGSGTGATFTLTYRRASSFQLGPLTIDNPVFVALDLSDIGAVLGVPLGGIVGIDFFERAEVSLDIANNVADVYPPNTWDAKTAKWEKLLVTGGSAVVAAKFDNVHQDYFGVDTGSNSALELYRGGVERYGFLKGEGLGRGRSGGAGGTYETATRKLAVFHFGGQDFKDTFASISKATVGASTSEYMAGNVGLPIFSHFKMLIDFPFRRIAFLPQPLR